MTTLITAAKETIDNKDWNQISEPSAFCKNMGLVGGGGGIPVGSQTWFRESHSHSKTRVGSGDEIGVQGQRSTNHQPLLGERKIKKKYPVSVQTWIRKRIPETVPKKEKGNQILLSKS